MLAHVPSFGRNPRGSPDFLAYPVPKACMHVLGTRVPRRLGVARSASSPKAALALGCSLTPGLRISFGRVTCMARAASVPGLWALGFLLLACICGWVRVAFGGGFCLPLPVVAGVLGGCVWARFVVLSLFCRLFVLFVVGLWCRPAFGTCVVSCAFPLPSAVSGFGVRCGRACRARVSAVPRPSWLGCRAVLFALFFFFPVAGCPRPGPYGLSPRLLSFGLGCWLFFFFLSACFGAPFPAGPLFLAWCRRFWLGGPPVPVWGSCLRCPLGGGFGPLLCCWRRFGGCGLFSRAHPPPLFFLGGGGGGRLAVPPFAFPLLALALWLVCGVVGPSPLLAEVPVCYSPPLLAGFRCRWWWAVPATPGWGLPAAVVCGGGVLVGLWLVCGVVGPSPLLAEVPVCYSPPLLAGFRCRWWWAVPATPGWGLLAAVVCGGGVLVGLWLVCGVVGPSPLLAEVPVCYSPPLLAAFRCRWWRAVPATPGWGPLAAVVCGVWCVVCGVWCVAVVCWWGCSGVWCGWSLATPGGGSCVLLPATPGWVSLPLVVGGPRHSWLGSACGGGVWCVVCGGGVLLGLWLVCGVVGPSPLLAEVPVCYSPPLLAGFRCRWWWAVPATPGWGPLAAVVCGVWCGVWCVVGVPRHSWLRFLCATPRHSWLGFAAAGGGRSPPLLAGVRWRRWCACFAWPGRAGRPPGRVLVRLTLSFGRFVFLLCLAPSGLGLPLSLSLLLPFLVGCFSRPPAAWLALRLCLLLGRWLLFGGCSPAPPHLCVWRFSSLLLVAFVFFFFSPSSSSSVRPRCLRLSLVSGPGCPGPRRLRCLFCWPSASRLSVRLSLFRAFRLAVGCSRVVAAPPPPLVSCGFRSCRSVLCAVLCCACLGAVLRRAAACCVARCCAVVCCVALAWCRCLLRRALWRCPSPWGPVLCGAVFCGVPPRCVLCAVCVLSWPGGACCCSPLCLVLCVSRGAVVCVPCALRSVRCCASLCWCARVVLFVWCVLLLAPGAVVRCCVLCCFLWCAQVRCWVWWPVVVCWWRVSVSVSLSGRVVCFPVVGVVCCVPCFPVLCFVVLCCRVVLCCCAMLSCCGAVGACFALLWAVVLCCVVLLVGCAVFGPVVVSACCGALFLVLCVPCLLRSVRCGALLCWLWCPASLCRVLWRCAVVRCCAVVLCCRFAALFVFALPSCGLSCGARVVCAVVGASCCGVSLCVVVSPWAFCGVVVLLWCVVVSCCAVRCPVVSCALCRVLRCRAVLRCCAGWLCCAVVCAAGVCFVLFSFAKNPCRFPVPFKTFFFFFLKIK